MFERYTEQARRVLFFGRYEASQHGASAIEPAHLLLALARQGWPLVDLLTRAALSVDDLRGAIEAGMPAGEAVATRVEIPFSATTKRVLSRAAGEADALGDPHVGSEHLLLAVVAESPESASWLTEHGLTLDRAREEIRQLDRGAPQIQDDAASLRSRAAHKVRQLQTAGAPHMPHGKPDVWPSYTVHILPTSMHAGRASRRGPDFWALDGVTLIEALAELYDIDENRIELPSTPGGDTRLNIVAVLPVRESEHVMHQLISEAIGRHFGLTLTLEPRLLDVYVVTPVDSSGSRSPEGSSGFGAISMPFTDPLPHDLDAMMRQLHVVMRAGGKILSGASHECCVGRTYDLPEAMLAQVQQQMRVEVTTDRREVLVLRGSR